MKKLVAKRNKAKKLTVNKKTVKDMKSKASVKGGRRAAVPPGGLPAY